MPEGWLGEAKYPVTVDPVVGSSTVGAYLTYKYISQEDYEWYLEDKADDPSTQFERYVKNYPVELIDCMAFNKLRTPSKLQGTYNVYLYVHSIYDYWDDEYTHSVFPFLYSNYNNKPNNLLALNGTFGNITQGLGSPKSFTPRWVQSTIAINGSVAANTDVWLGFWGKNGAIPFDYGVPCIQSDLIMYPDQLKNFNSLYELAVDYNYYNINDCEDRFSYELANAYPGARNDFKLSMYLGIPESYTRTLYQGAAISEARKLTGSYKRSAAQTVRGTAVAARFEGFCRSLAQTVKNTMTVKGPLALLRKLTQQVGTGAALGRVLSMLRKPTETARTEDGIKRITQAKRIVADTGQTGAAIGRFIGRLRIVQDTEAAGDAAGHRADYLRGLFVEAGSIAGTTHRAEYHREQQDTAYSEAVSLRHLFIFLRLITGTFIRDFIIRRFLKSREELVIKSPVRREITLDSRLH